MSIMIGPRKGIIRGKLIELVQPTSLPDGSEVNVSIESTNGSVKAETTSLQQAFGGWADDAEGLDEFLEWNRQQRKQSRPELLP